MEINITALDYFRELELMENQYGQEEDLYPWIYMLLQMAEYKKSKGENYHSISIRDVHNWKKKGAPKDMIESCKKTILNKISSNLGGPPEFLILDTNKNSKQPDFLGAIEMKIFKDSGTLELKQGQYNIIDGIHRSVCKVTYKFNIPKEEFIDKKDELIEILTDEFKKFDPKVLDYKVNFHFSNKNVHHYQLIIEKAHKINKQMIEEFF